MSWIFHLDDEVGSEMRMFFVFFASIIMSQTRRHLLSLVFLFREKNTLVLRLNSLLI